MTDYPTREAINAAKATLIALIQPAEVLAAAEQRATVGSTEHHILLAAYDYATTHPEWFAASLIDDPAAMLQRAAWSAAEYEDQLARHTLKAAAYVALRHPDWFGGAS